VILADLINIEQLVPLAVFGMIAASAWWLLEFLSRKRGRDVERLEEMNDPSIRRRKADDAARLVKKQDAMTRVLERATPALARPLQPRNELEASRLKARLASAGFRGEAVSSIFLGMKFAGLLGGLFFSGITIATIATLNQRSIMYAVALAGGLFYLPDMVLWVIGRRRREAIFLGLPDALDLMVVCVEAGLGLDQAMRKVADEMKKTYPVIAMEFGLANFQLQMGRKKADVLHELGLRSGVDDLRALAAILIQADKFGSSIAQALRVQSDSMRTRRRQLAEEKAAKTAVKLIFPLVIFIFPGIFVVLVGPAAITMVRQMFPMMQGK
jgi:tight adherence protein C